MARCEYCGYYRQIKRKDGSIRHYCSDRDCMVAPCEPECNEY